MVKIFKPWREEDKSDRDRSGRDYRCTCFLLFCEWKEKSGNGKKCQETR